MNYFNNIRKYFRFYWIITYGHCLFILLFPSSQLLQSVEYEKAVDDLKIGVLLPLTGAGATFSQTILNGLESALSPLAMTKNKVNGQHHDLHEKIKLIVRDHKGDLTLAKKLADELYIDDRVSFLVGGLSEIESSHYAELSSLRGKMFISLLPKNIEGLAQHSRSLSFSSSYDWQLKVIAQHLNRQLPLSSVNQVTLVIANTIKGPRPPHIQKMVTSFFNYLTEQPLANIWQHVISVEDNTVMTQNSHEYSQNNHTALEQIAQSLMARKTQVAVIALGLSDSIYLLDILEKLNYQGSVYGLDYWEHPSFRPSKSPLNIHYVVSYDQSFLSKDFREIYFFHTGEKPSVLAALGFDVASFIMSLYSQTKSVRIPPFLRLIEGQKIMTAPASFQGTYRRGEDHFIERKMVLRSFKPRTTSLIGDVDATKANISD
ncbi:MAG: ABC transporter substrate-binding protein [Proteobacteria bacterium]|nr:ABC transporter substrate-binding protein [Pseudomonadota bacterium]